MGKPDKSTRAEPGLTSKDTKESGTGHEENGADSFAQSNSANLHSKLIETMRDGLSVQDENGVIKFVNDKLCELWGYSREELLWNPVTDFYDDDNRKILLEKMASRKAGERQHFEIEVTRKDGTLLPTLVSVTPLHDSKGNYQGSFENITDITKQKQTEESLEESEEALHTLTESMIGVTGQECFDKITQELCEWFDADCAIIGEITRGNTVKTLSMRLDGTQVEEFTYKIDGSPCERATTDGPCMFPRDIQKHFPNDRELIEMDAEGYVGAPIKNREGTAIGILCVISRKPMQERHQWRDILTVIASKAAAEIERFQTGEKQRLAHRILETLNNPEGHSEAVREILRLIKDFTGFDAIGIRLREDDDYPYFYTEGMDGKFIEAENYLGVKDASGEISRDPDGKSILECLCGTVLLGKTDPSFPFFTDGGSFWTNSTTEFRKEVPVGGDARIRHTCNKFGYESVALIPLHTGEQTVGLLQLNDSHRGCFTLEMIEFFERVGEGIGIALARNNAERALQESEARWRSICENTPYYIMLLDQKENIQFINRTVPDVSLEGVIGTPVYQHIPLESRLKALECHENVRKTGNPGSYEVEYVTKDGESRIFEVFVGPVKESGDEGALVSCSIDITNRKGQEDDRKLLEEQVQHAQKLESLAVLAGGIAHDFNNLLTAILGNADLALRDPALAPSLEVYIDEIEKAAVDASELCQQMLAYSGRGRFVVDTLDLSDLVNGISQVLKVSLRKNATLNYSLDESLPHIEADAAQVRQIIMNLVSNASEAIGNEEGNIAVRTGSLECDISDLSETYLDEGVHPGMYVYIEVTDNGCGMNDETIEKIFDPFFTTKFTGRGLGMAAVAGIVRGHKGVIKVHSEMGKGSTIRILFPASEKVQIADIQPDASVDSQSTPAGEGMVLLVDDEETVLEVGRRMLECLGFDVITATDGREAVNIYSQHMDHVSCVILDLTMPYMGGETAFKELRSINREVLILMSSGYNEQDVTKLFDGKGLTGFIHKPYQLGVLASKLRAIFDQKKTVHSEL